MKKEEKIPLSLKIDKEYLLIEMKDQQLKDLMEEGVFDWLGKKIFGKHRWDRKGHKGFETEDTLDDYMNQIIEMRRYIKQYHDDYPRITKLLMSNLKRVENDILTLQVRIATGKPEHTKDEEDF